MIALIGLFPRSPVPSLPTALCNYFGTRTTTAVLQIAKEEARQQRKLARIERATRARFPGTPSALVATNWKLLEHLFVTRKVPESEVAGCISEWLAIPSRQFSWLGEYVCNRQRMLTDGNLKGLAYHGIRAMCETHEGMSADHLPEMLLLNGPPANVATVKEALAVAHGDLRTLRQRCPEVLQWAGQEYFVDTFAHMASLPPYHFRIADFVIYAEASWPPFSKLNEEFAFVPPEQLADVARKLEAKKLEYVNHKACLDLLSTCHYWVFAHCEDIDAE